MKRTNIFKFLYKLIAAAAIIAGFAGDGAAQLSKADLDIWKDPAFKKQFAESYLAETDIEPRVTVNDRDLMAKILELISTEKIDEAINMLQKNQGEAANAIFDFTLANLYFQQEKLVEAAGAYQIAVDKYPKFRRAWRNLGLIHIRQNEFDKALPALTKVIELGGGDSLTYGLLGFAYSSVDNNLSAESAYRMAILLDAKTLDWKLGLARSLFKQENYGQAVALCARMIEEQPERADFWMLQANAYIGLKQPLKAAENYEFIDRMGKSSAESLNMLGDIYVNEELFELAVDSYIRAMKKDPDASTQRAIRAAKVLTTRGALHETKQLVENIEKLKGGDLEADDKKDLLKLRARLAVASGSGSEEARVLEEIITLDPLDGEALILLGQHANRGGNNEKAVFYYERAAAIEKFEADAKVRHAQLLVGTGKYDEALPLLRRAQTLNPRDDVQKYLQQVEQVAKAK